jgi:type I restriction enzyme, S subunit
MSELPKGWKNTSVGEVTLSVSKINLKSELNRQIKYIDISSIDKRNNTVADVKALILAQAPSRARQIVKENDILFSTVRPYLRNIAAVPQGLDGEIASTGFSVLRPVSLIEPRYLYYYCISNNFVDAVSRKQYGVSYPAVKDSQVRSQNFPLAPLQEQKRIADKLDQIFEELDGVKARLDKIPSILRNFRQRLIDKEVNQIQESRNEEYIELKNITHSISDGDHQAPPKTEQGIPFLVISNISQGYVDIDGATRFVSEEYYNNLKYIRTPRKGDILYSVTGSIGIPAIVETKEKFCFQRHIAIIKPNNELVITKFLFYYLKSSFILEQAELVATGTAQITVPLQGLRKFQIKVPAIDVQTKIVKFLDANLELANHMEKQYKRANEQVNHITHSVLNKAFRGELVPQDPKDEPASVLLERIKEEKEFQTETFKLKTLNVSGKIRGNHKKTEDTLMTKKLQDVLAGRQEWLSAQEAFQLCGIGNGSQTEEIETLYAELRFLDKLGKLEIDAVYNSDGTKQHDRLKLKKAG